MNKIHASTAVMIKPKGLFSKKIYHKLTLMLLSNSSIKTLQQNFNYLKVPSNCKTS